VANEEAWTQGQSADASWSLAHSIVEARAVRSRHSALLSVALIYSISISIPKVWKFWKMWKFHIFSQFSKLSRTESNSGSILSGFRVQLLHFAKFSTFSQKKCEILDSEKFSQKVWNFRLREIFTFCVKFHILQEMHVWRQTWMTLAIGVKLWVGDFWINEFQRRRESTNGSGEKVKGGCHIWQFRFYGQEIS
jgi:hypothetical protein